MPSLTLLAADPHLTPVRARPALAFGGQAAGVQRHGRGRRLRLSPRRRRDERAGAATATPHPGGTSEARASAAQPRRARRPALRNRGVPPRSGRRSVFGWRGAIAAAVLGVIVAGLGVLRVWPPLAVVMSGSMTPTIKTGDMVVLMHHRGPARVGEVVEVPVPDDARTRYGYPPVVIHRVFRITGGEIRTKGDAWPAADPFTVPQTAVRAKVVADIPAGGRVLSFFHSGPGLLWLLFGAALFFGLPLLDRLRDARGHEAEVTGDLRDQLAAVSAGLAHLQTEQQRSRQAADETLAQIGRLPRLVAEALGREPSAPGGDPGAPVGTPGDTADPRDGDSGTSAPAAAVPGGTDAPASEPSFASVLDPADAEGPPVAAAPGRGTLSADKSRLTAVAEPAALTARVIGREPAPDQESAPTNGPTEEARVELTPQRESAVRSGAAVQPHPATRETWEPGPALQPVRDPDGASATQSVEAARVAVGKSAGGNASGRLCVSPPGTTDAPRETVAAGTMACSSALVARISAPIGATPSTARPLPALERWDAPPAALAVDAGGWAAPPVMMRSARFQRPGRLIAASLAQPSSRA